MRGGFGEKGRLTAKKRTSGTKGGAGKLAAGNFGSAEKGPRMLGGMRLQPRVKKSCEGAVSDVGRLCGGERDY